MNEISNDICNNFVEADILKYMNCKHPTFGQALWKILDWKEMSVKDLSEKCYLSTGQIYRYLRDEIRFIQIETVISFCVGLDVTPSISKVLIDLADCGNAFDKSRLSYIYKFIIKHAREWTLDDVNEYIDTLNEASGIRWLEYYPNKKSYQRHLKTVQEG